MTFIANAFIVNIIMKSSKRKFLKKIKILRSHSTKSDILQKKILDYCGYKLVDNKLVGTDTYNPVPYQGL